MSMDFYAGRIENNTVGFVFSAEEMKEGTWVEVPGTYEKFVPNPDYREDLNLNLANSNMRLAIEALGLSFEDDHFSNDIDPFIAVATQWLQKHIGKLSAETPVTIEKGPTGPTMIGGGHREGYSNDTIRRMVHIAREGKARGATLVYAA